MADLYEKRDVKSLLRRRKILFIGDSNVRPLYKDLLCALTQRALVDPQVLKNTDARSYYGDILIEQCGNKQQWDFMENRIYDREQWKVEMLFTGQITVRTHPILKAFLSHLRNAQASTIPDVIYMSYDVANGRNDTHLIKWFMTNLKESIPGSTLVIVGSAFPTSECAFGPLFDEITSFHLMSDRDKNWENSDLMDMALSCQFDTLNIHHYLQKSVFRWMTVQTGWESVVVRFVTCLILTYIAHALKVELPNRVKKDVLAKAKASGCIDAEIKNLLLKYSPNWFGIKSHKRMEEANDSVKTNAEEVFRRLWKIYYENSEEQQKQSSQTYDSPQSQSIITVAVPQTTSLSQCTEKPRKVGSGNHSDEESLEEGEIRDDSSPIREFANEENHSRSFSDTSSNEDDGQMHNDEASARFSLPNAEISPAPNIFFQQQQQQVTNDDSHGLHDPCYQPYWCSTYNLNPPTTSELETIVISDDDDDVCWAEEGVMMSAAAEGETIDLVNSEGNLSLGSELTAPQIILNSAARTTRMPSTKCTTSTSVMLRGEDGSLKRWPSSIGISYGKDRLWKWWRKYIEKNNNMLIINYKDFPELCALNPTPPGGKCSSGAPIAVPKIVDDLCEFFKLVEGMTPPDNLDMRSFIDDEGESNERAERRVLPLAEELTRASVKKVNFEIADKGNDVRFPANEAKIGIRSFASTRRFTSQAQSHSADHSGMPSTSRANDDVSRTQVNVPKLHLKITQPWTPFSPWISTSSNTERGGSEGPRVLNTNNIVLSSQESTSRIHEKRNHSSVGSSDCSAPLSYSDINPINRLKTHSRPPNSVYQHESYRSSFKRLKY